MGKKTGNSEVASWVGDALFSKKPGTATLSVSVPIPNSRKMVTAAVTIKVKKTVTNLNCKTLHLYTGSSYLFFPTVQGASSKTTWSCSDPKVLKLDKSRNKITALKPGSATVTITANGYSSSCKVRVTEKPTAKLSATTLTLEAGKSKILTVKTKGATGSKQWTSNNPNVAAVNSSGKVTAKQPGTAIIRFLQGGAKASCTVTVTTPPVDLSIYFQKKYSFVRNAFPTGKRKTGYDAFSDTDYYNYSIDDIVQIDFYHPAKPASQALANAIAIKKKTDKYSIYGITYGMKEKMIASKAKAAGFVLTDSEGGVLSFMSKKNESIGLSITLARGMAKIIMLDYTYE